MYRAPQNATSVFGDPASFAHEVAVEAVGIEWCVRRHELCHSLQACVQCVVCCLLVGIHLATPETLAVQSNIPVAQVVLHEVRDSATRFRWLVCLVCGGHLFDEGVEARENPFVDLGEAIGYWRLAIGERRGIPSIHVGIEGEEAIGVVEGAEELTADLVHTFWVELQVLPWAGVGEHVPAHRICSVLVECAEWINCVAKAFGHLVAVLIEYESVANHVLVCHAALNHRMDSVKREEPTACLVHTFGDEVCGAWSVLVLKWVVVLCVRHCA